MASYTMQLRDYIEMWSQDNIDNMKWADIIEAGRTNLFDFDYPIFDETYRKDFETHFIRNFYMREIGFETEGLFKFQLETWLNINMPYWNKMYTSETLTYDPLKNTSIDVTKNKTNDTKTTNTTNSTYTGSNNETVNSTKTDDNFDRRLESNTPDSRLQISATDGEGVIDYASAIEENNTNNSTTVNGTNDTSSNGTQSNTSNGTKNDTETDTESTDGKIGSQTYAKMIQEHRETFLRIDKMIFKEMNELFMLVY